MTRATTLVLDGETVKVRLQAERRESGELVHVDWLRFTVLLRNMPCPSVDEIFPRTDDWAAMERWRELARQIQEVPDCNSAAAQQAIELARSVAEVLGDDYEAIPEPRKGHDFYKFRIAIERAGAEVGWVGFQASSSSPRQAAQGRTIHCNLFGAACTFARAGWRRAMADLIDARQGEVTRCDLALDFFEGIPGGLPQVVSDYEAGKLDVHGKRPKCRMVGDWSACTKGARSFYVGSKEAGKETNFYEKGDQLFGVEAGSAWVRAEGRLGNKLRELPTDLLRRPADFFAGMSDYHAALLTLANGQAQAQRVRCRPRLALETVKAEVHRAVRWIEQTGGAMFAFALRSLPEEKVLELMGDARRPGRLSKFSTAEIASAVSDLLSAEGPSPAFT